MKRTLIVAALALLGVAPLAAQETPRPPRPPRAPRAETRVFSFSSRGRIGVVVNTTADADKDKIGAQIEAVTPGGPADDAGLKAGDLITKFNGTALGGAAAEDEDESGPGNKLIELARALDPGDTVRIEYRRGGETKQATLVAEDLGNSWARIEMPMIPRIEVNPRVEVGPRVLTPGFDFDYLLESPWGGLELVTINPDLGEYFGTREGVLVVKAPGDSSLPLKGGDVILAIDGRKPTSPSHAMRILRSYDEGEAVKIDVMRRQRRTTVSWTVPERASGLMRTSPRMRRPRGGGEPS